MLITNDEQRNAITQGLSPFSIRPQPDRTYLIWNRETETSLASYADRTDAFRALNRLDAAWSERQACLAVLDKLLNPVSSSADFNEVTWAGIDSANLVLWTAIEQIRKSPLPILTVAEMPTRKTESQILRRYDERMPDCDCGQKVEHGVCVGCGLHPNDCGDCDYKRT